MKQKELKKANTHYPVLDIIKNRWSPVVYDDKAIGNKDMMSIFEAARWSPSSRNEQPWRYIYGHKGDNVFNDLLDCLMPGNKIWAKNASVLIASLAEKDSAFNGKPMRHYFYDTGAANAMMQIQAISMGIYSHSMGGFYSDKLIKKFNIDESMEPATIIAMGYLGNINNASDDLKKRDLEKRKRFDLKKIILNS